MVTSACAYRREARHRREGEGDAHADVVRGADDTIGEQHTIFAHAANTVPTSCTLHAVLSPLLLVVVVMIPTHDNDVDRHQPTQNTARRPPMLPLPNR